MTESEQVEYAGLAATVGRLMASLKQTEAVLAETMKALEQAVDERDAALAKTEETDEGS